MSFKLKDKVKMVGGPTDVKGKIGRIGEIRQSVSGEKTYTIDYEVEGRDGETSIQLKAKDLRVLKESITFKEFMESKKLTCAGIAINSKTDEELKKMNPEELEKQLAYHQKQSQRHYNGHNIQGGDYHRLEADHVKNYI